MRRIPSSVSLVIAFIAGCAAAPLVIPPLSAQQEAAGARRWEYVCLDLPSGFVADYIQDANQLGAQGWEYSHPFRNRYECFKRPL